jgi:FAD-dependent urate hydroxylase
MMRRVLVVGCGLAGMAAARGLRAIGDRVDVVEVRRELCEPGAGLLLTGNAVSALDDLGLGRALREAGRLVDMIAFADERGAELFQLDLAGRPGWADFVSIHRKALQAILLVDDASDRVRLGVSVDALELRETGVRVRFSTGESVDYDLVIGADGMRSRVRELAFGGAAADAIPGFAGWRFITRCPPDLSRALYMLGNGRTLLLHPLAGGEVYCGAGPVDTGIADADDGDDLSRLRAAFCDFGGPAKSVLENVDEGTSLIPTLYWQTPRATFTRGRCVLIGDAAHTCAPTLSQGAALAFEDAAVLCELLARGDDLDANLRAYEARRAPRVEPVLRESRARIEANRAVDPSRLELRNQVLRKVGASQLAAAWAPLMEKRA